jgi:hypothetical protein
MPTQNSDVLKSPGAGIEYAGPGIKWKIAHGVVVGSAVSFGVHSAFNGSKLVNRGDVFGDTFGVLFEAQKNGTVINKAGASIVGDIGVAFANVANAKNMTVMNDGKIVGISDTGVVAVDVSNFELHNTGKIFGGFVGVHATVTTPGASDGPMIENSGVIRSGQYGINVSTLPGLKATVVNKSGGTLQADKYAIFSAGGNLSVENHGKIKGSIRAAPNANDKVVNDGLIKGETFLGPGNDTFKNAGGHAGRVHGGDGNDTLIAGSHKDRFVFDATLNPVTNVDRVKHFDPGTDKLILDQSFFLALSGPGTLTGAEFHKGAHAHDLDDRIIYHKATGALYYDEDGTGGGFAQVEFAKLDKGLNLHASDFVVIA